MDVDPSFSERVSAFGRRVALLRKGVKESGGESLMAGELSTAIEELRASEEELRSQQEELLRMQSQLEEERARYRDLFEQAPHAYLVTNERGMVEEANQAAGRLLGVQPRYIAGKPLLLYFPPADLRVIRSLMRSIVPGAVQEFTARLSPRGGPMIHIQGSIAAVTIRSDGVERTGYRWLLVDASARIKAEMEAQACRDELVRAQEAYAAGLPADTREALKAGAEERAAREQAEQASRMKDQFLALVVHELRNPLTPVLTALEELLEQKNPRPETTRESLEMMHRNLISQSRMIGDLLDIARIIHGKMELRRAAVALTAPLKEAVEGLSEAAAGKRQTLRTELSSENPVVYGDSVRLRQVFWNLISNAIKFTPIGGEISVRLFADKENAFVEVRDTGMGINSASLPRIFDAFEQTPSQYARSLGGLGLGLSIVRSLVESHGGTVEATSRGEGHGSMFRVRLPRTSEVPKAPPTEPHESRSARPLRILVVEDHADTRKALANLLSKLGNDVHTAGTVEEAILETQGNHFDLMISDLSLPDGNGYDILQRAPRENVAFAVACSGWGMPEDIERSRSAGFSLHLTKPVSIDQLRDILARFSKA